MKFPLTIIDSACPASFIIYFLTVLCLKLPIGAYLRWGAICDISQNGDTNDQQLKRVFLKVYQFQLFKIALLVIL